MGPSVSPETLMLQFASQLLVVRGPLYRPDHSLYILYKAAILVRRSQFFRVSIYRPRESRLQTTRIAPHEEIPHLNIAFT